jgi:hypothetical protein
MATLHPLAQKYPRLVNPDLSADLNTFYNTLGAALGEYEAAVDKARKVSPDYIPAKRAARQHEIIAQARKKLNDTLAKELQPLGASIGALRQEITAKSLPQTPDNAVLAYLREMENRQQLRQMDPELRAKLLRESVARGDRSLLTALEGSLTPIVPAILLDSAREDYARAVAAPAVERLEEAETLLESARETARRANYEADKLVKGAKEILPLPPGEKTPSPAAHLSDSEKAALVGKVGLEGFKSILAGEMALPPAYWADADKEAFAAKHGGEAWEKFIAGEWTPPAE